MRKIAINDSKQFERLLSMVSQLGNTQLELDIYPFTVEVDVSNDRISFELNGRNINKLDVERICNIVSNS